VSSGFNGGVTPLKMPSDAKAFFGSFLGTKKNNTIENRTYEEGDCHARPSLAMTNASLIFRALLGKTKPTH